MSNASDQQTNGSSTFAFKAVDGINLLMDVYSPSCHRPSYTADGSSCPIVVYFHGGGLTVGNRNSWFPHWLYRRMTAAGCAFASVEYRLAPPSTGHDILTDVQDAFHFVLRELNGHLLQRNNGHNAEITTPIFQIDPGRIAVVGTSSGGLCAYLAAMHAVPSPKVILSMYGMGGDMLTTHYFMPKQEVFFRGRELLDPARFSEYLYPACRRLPATANSPLAYHPPSSPTPGYPANPRMQLARLYFQLGTYLDYYTGHHEPSLSAALQGAANTPSHSGRELDADMLMSLIPSDLLHLFPQYSISKSTTGLRRWPATFLVHGTADTAIRADESRNLHAILRRADVDVTLRLVEGEEHSFDYVQDAEGLFGGEGGLFDEASDFLLRHLGVTGAQP
ncbi:alpha/beta-hydrolase [Fomitopsis serialis]|uniref:alpha/beta-hydrolase n=1 Tax=Fomitopsis serialis TaxID=139415 RepID=UPI00200871AE|nr:alpha/beta-hydrolase [Neoantrodia serialis]KAH9936340.1 alpha/beta-hydrolase [Neoantrodia serialis]